VLAEQQPASCEAWVKYTELSAALRDPNPGLFPGAVFEQGKRRPERTG
jgi:hypothetical protein